MKLHSFTFNPFSENTYIIEAGNGDCAIVDPGNSNSAENAQLLEAIESTGLKPVMLLNTHAHIDHVFGNHWVKDRWDIALHLHKLDLPLLDRSVEMAKLWGLNYTPSPSPDAWLEPGTITLGGEELEIRFVPGHAPGHVVFISHADKWIVAGDTLFNESIGRTDLPGGHHQTLLDSIQKELFTLPDDYTVWPGHGPETRIGHEKKFNPYLSPLQG